MRVVLDTESADLGLRRVAREMVERHRGTLGLVLVGVRRGGVPLANNLKAILEDITGDTIALGSVDITLYRDDAATALPNPRIGPSEIPVSLEGKRVVLVDDVLFTGRTIRAGIDALMDYGRPKSIELCVLVDRGGRELPIQADYVVKKLEVESSERVDVVSSNRGFYAVVQDSQAPSLPPQP
ncbi:MAG: bifunctional pyr operon transcriptional regulator/uracil phosphoribosyltransferase PyrR [Polyangiaceae bacterium]|nr:bifunctional pyr operon transcriptional regulator/uracil phosphoribosyltransferase PyrR [Polyangiaceae bacterium]